MRTRKSPEAIEVGFDDTTCQRGVDTTQEIIEELCSDIDNLQDTSLPSFTWGISGSVKNTYLLNETVPSNVTGRIVPVTGILTNITVANEDAQTFTIEIRERNGGFTTIASLSLVNERKKTATINVPITAGDELSCYISAGVSEKAKNPVVFLIMEGT